MSSSSSLTKHTPIHVDSLNNLILWKLNLFVIGQHQVIHVCIHVWNERFFNLIEHREVYTVKLTTHYAAM